MSMKYGDGRKNVRYRFYSSDVDCVYNGLKCCIYVKVDYLQEEESHNNNDA